MKSRTSLFVIGILIAMLAASLLTVLALFLTGTLAPNRPLLEFTVKAVAAKEYDGTPLVAEAYDWESGAKNLKDGHKLEGRFYGAQTDVGVSDSDLRVKVYDEKDRDVTSEYSIKVNNCELRVLRRAITVFLEPGQIQYSGKEIPIENYAIYDGHIATPDSDREMELIEGQKLIVSFPGQFENVGDKLPAFKEWKAENFKVYNVMGNDVSDNYVFAWGMAKNGTIEIIPRIIKVKALDAEKYYDGTPIDGKGKYEVIGSLAEGEYVSGVEFEDEDGNELSANVGEYKVKVSKVSFYKQDGFNVVPAENYIWKSDDDDVYGTFTVKKRPVTVWAEDIVKLYDGESLSVDNDSFSTDLTLEGYDVEIVEVEGDGIADVYDSVYSITEVAVKRDGLDFSGQFDIHYEKATARATILPIRIQFRLNSPDSQIYKGEVIKIPLDAAMDGLDVSISDYITANNLSGEIADILGEIDSDWFQQVCSETVKNAGTYYFNAEFTEEVVQDVFNGKTGNVIFEFTSAKFRINKARLTGIWYSGTGRNLVEKIYDGQEAKLALDSSNVRLEGFNNLAVSSVDFRYDDNLTNHIICKTYTVLGNVVQIINTKTSEDVTKNFATDQAFTGNDADEKDDDRKIAPFTVSVKITERTTSAILTKGSKEVDYTVSSVANTINNSTLIYEILEEFRDSIGFNNLVAGDRVDSYYDELPDNHFDDVDFELDYDTEDNSSILLYVSGLKIVHRDPNDENVANCYHLENAEIPLITIHLVEG